MTSSSSQAKAGLVVDGETNSKTLPSNAITRSRSRSIVENVLIFLICPSLLCVVSKFYHDFWKKIMSE